MYYTYENFFFSWKINTRMLPVLPDVPTGPLGLGFAGGRMKAACSHGKLYRRFLSSVSSSPKPMPAKSPSNFKISIPR